MNGSPIPSPVRYTSRLVIFAVLLTQLPAIPFLGLSRPSGLAIGLYLAASVVAATGFVVAGVRWSRRIDRIVRLVRGFSQNGCIPTAERSSANVSVRAVALSLEALDGTLRRLEEDAALDPLTGTLNRRVCVIRLASDLARAQRSKEPFSIALFDLDSLKAVNDRHGHRAGDEALKMLAGALQSVTRAGDWVARWGGDEFLLALWGADAVAAGNIVERALQRLSNSPIEVNGETIAIRACFGVAEARETDDAERLFERCDAALLAEKRLRQDPITPA